MQLERNFMHYRYWCYQEDTANTKLLNTILTEPCAPLSGLVLRKEDQLLCHLFCLEPLEWTLLKPFPNTFVCRETAGPTLDHYRLFSVCHRPASPAKEQLTGSRRLKAFSASVLSQTSCGVEGFAQESSQVVVNDRALFIVGLTRLWLGSEVLRHPGSQQV